MDGGGIYVTLEGTLEIQMHRLALVPLSVAEGKVMFVLACYGGPVGGGPAVTFWDAGIKRLASPEKGMCLLIHEAAFALHAYANFWGWSVIFCAINFPILFHSLVGMILLQLKSFCMQDKRADFLWNALPVLWTPHAMMEKTRVLDQNWFRCFIHSLHATSWLWLSPLFA